VCAALDFAEAYKRNQGKPRLASKSAILLNMLGDHAPRKGNAPAGTDWTPYQCVRRMLDFITGMTDGFALRVSSQLSGHIEQRVL
jgi:dGTP triphosphohydrolase